MTAHDPAPRSRLGAALQRSASRVRVWANPAISRFRAQIDKTGLFPDLHGDAGSALRQSVRDEGELTKAYMLMCALSGGIATLGLLQSSTAVVIGAMLISPLMGPIASLGFGFASIDGKQIRAAMRVIALGAAIGVLTGMLLTWLSPIRNATPEIIARTAPTLLDLAIAILSGMAGAYATVQQKGATAIGVAIATALMPPLATVGYGLGVFSLSFAAGAFLLFLTNLAAIAFSFALIARLSGAARPLARVEITPRHVIGGIAAFLVLATPLAVTLYRVRAESQARAEVRRVIEQQLGVKGTAIAQLDVDWPLRGVVGIDAVVISGQYSADADSRITRELEASLGRKTELNLQQVLATDIDSRTRAIVDAAVQRSAAGIAGDVPPLGAIRATIGLPTQALWVNRGERSVQVVPFAAQGWTLADYRQLETQADAVAGGWKVRILPPVRDRLVVPLTIADDLCTGGPALDDALWAIGRWAAQGVAVNGYAGANRSAGEIAQAQSCADFVVSRLKQDGISARSSLRSSASAAGEGKLGVEIQVVRQPPSATAQTKQAGENRALVNN
ncbi:MAG: DUF389 domain-containing protein [Novosphingobium sp.]|uniref:DUF389 domain-containing protein n=1 Tax=Novosphingobium sp. TaxID=1874826 RepID=UPI001D7B422C|nr:DUF389 domain-containing protein [Novosphingobium sp.]MCB2057172.1 DUF389 domain-containing protein [Novosphingobium sp.]MCP5386486.1 DUF389 domain-containing protein [Novosphingobium sp.]